MAFLSLKTRHYRNYETYKPGDIKKIVGHVCSGGVRSGVAI
jgi:hypothetical protein